MGQAMIIIFLGAMLSFTMLLMGSSHRAGESVELGSGYFEAAVARNMAESAANVAAARLSRAPDDYRGLLSPVTIGSGTLSAMVARLPRSGLVSVRGNGLCGQTADTVGGRFSIIPTFILGAVSGNVTVELLGGMTIDGRDHLADGTVVEGEGMYSVMSTADVIQSGSSTLGGTDADGYDHPPSGDPDPDIFSANAQLIADYPLTPEGALGGADAGFTPGFLKQYAQSGQNGSQYVTNPAALRFPLGAVTYVELPDNGVWLNIEFGLYPNHSKGIIVCHNPQGTAGMKLLQAGLIEGILLADQVDKIHTTIRGALVLLGGPQVGNCIGNGNGILEYSTEVIQHCISAVGKQVVSLQGWQ